MAKYQGVENTVLKGKDDLLDTSIDHDFEQWTKSEISVQTIHLNLTVSGGRGDDITALGTQFLPFAVMYLSEKILSQ